MAKKKLESVTTDESPQEALFNAVLSQVRKELGDEAVMSLTDPSATVDVIETDYIGVNYIIGGGIPRKRITELYSSFGSGKTSMALHAVAKVQQAGGRAVYVDAELALNPSLARCLGVDLDKLVIVQPVHGEQAFEIMQKFIKTGAVDLVVVDSVHALIPQAVAEADISDNHMADLARLLSKAIPVIRKDLLNSNAALIFINQMRDKISMGFGGHGGKTTPGGNALPYYSDVRIQAIKLEKLKAGELVYGHRTKFICEKTRFTSPYRDCCLDYIYGEGFCKYRELIEMGVQFGILQQAGAWFNYGEQRLGQGKGNTVNVLKDDLALYNDIRDKVLVAFKQ